MNTIDCSPKVFIVSTSRLLRETRMEHRKGFATALRQLRTSKGLTQEDFSDVSSRTYLSSLERCMKSPTLEKVEELSGVMGVHPATLLILAYSRAEDIKFRELLHRVTEELKSMNITT